MTVDVKYIESSNYLSVSCLGRYDFEALKGAIDLISEHSLNLNCPTALIDYSVIDGKLSNADKYNIGEYIARKLSSRTKLAVVDKPENINKFGETVAVNRGAFVRVFSNKEDAVKWHIG